MLETEGQIMGLFIHHHQQECARRLTMWVKPSYQELRLGFEVTLYISNR